MEGIALHGIGINFKSSIAKRFVRDNPGFSLNLSTQSRLHEIKKVLGVSDIITTHDRLLTRLISMSEEDCIYDRTCLDEWIFAKMNYEGINWYYKKENDPGIETILARVDRIIEYESRFITKRVLIITKNKKLLSENINLDSEHNKLRFDLYETIDQYFYKQSVFCDIFRKMNVEYTELEIPDNSLSLNKLFDYTYERFCEIYNNNSES